MSNATSAVDLANAIVASIRQGVLDAIAAHPDNRHDPWDEKRQGVAWCDNEISIFDDLCRIANPEFDLPEIIDCSSVDEVVLTLQNRRINVLEALHRFCQNRNDVHFLVAGREVDFYLLLLERGNQEEIRSVLNIHS